MFLWILQSNITHFFLNWTLILIYRNNEGLQGFRPNDENSKDAHVRVGKARMTFEFYNDVHNRVCRILFGVHRPRRFTYLLV